MRLLTNWQLVHKTTFRLCFTCLILTLKQAPRMHQNAPFPDKKSKKISGPSPDPSGPHWGGGYPHLGPHPPRHHDYRTFGAWRSRSFSFTTRTLSSDRFFYMFKGYLYPFFTMARVAVHLFQMPKIKPVWDCKSLRLTNRYFKWCHHMLPPSRASLQVVLRPRGHNYDVPIKSDL